MQLDKDGVFKETLLAIWYDPFTIASFFYNQGNFYFSRATNIYKVVPGAVTSTVTVWMGSTTSGNVDGIGVSAMFTELLSLRLDPSGTRLICVDGDRFRMVNMTSNQVTTLTTYNAIIGAAYTIDSYGSYYFYQNNPTNVTLVKSDNLTSFSTVLVVKRCPGTSSLETQEGSTGCLYGYSSYKQYTAPSAYVEQKLMLHLDHVGIDSNPRFYRIRSIGLNQTDHPESQGCQTNLLTSAPSPISSLVSSTDQRSVSPLPTTPTTPTTSTLQPTSLLDDPIAVVKILLQCTQGYYLNLTTFSCQACPSGFHSPGMLMSCQPCDPGTFSPSAGSAYCLPCPSGTVAIGPGSTTCSAPCLTGQYAVERKQCLDCPAGSYSSSGSI